MTARERLLKFGSRSRWTVASGMPRGWYPALHKLEREGLAEIKKRPGGIGRHFYTVTEYRLTSPGPLDNSQCIGSNHD